MSIEYEFVEMLFISALAGGLLGVERELKTQPLAGTRTFMLISTLGALSVYVSERIINENIISLALLGVVLLAILVGLVKNFRSYDFGITTSFALILAFFLGLLIGAGYHFQGIAASIIITSILVFKKYTTILSESLNHDEMRSSMEFGIVAFVLYPVVPDEPIDPYGLINPKTLLMVVIAVSSIGFAGFLALRNVGPERGLPIVGALGGLVNSEATASALAIKATKANEFIPNAIKGILLSNSVMLLRNLVLAILINLNVFIIMLVPHLVMSFMGYVYTMRIRLEKSAKETEINLESPFAIIPSIRFGILFTIISLIANFLKDFGQESIYFASILGGFVSSAAVTASMASLAATGTLDTTTAAYACIMAALSSTGNKILITRISGSKDISKKLVFPISLILFLGILSIIIIN